MRDKVKMKPMSGDIWMYDGLGEVEANEMVGRYKKVVFDSIEHWRRKVSRRRFVVTLPIDASDVRGALVNPGSEYPRACAMATPMCSTAIGYSART